MEAEVMVAVPPPPPPMDFNFDSNCSSPYITAPSSPQPFGNLFFSAPNNNHLVDPNEDFDFEFNFSGQLQRPSLSADELFHGGKILPLKLISSSPIQEGAAKQPPHKMGKERASSFSIPSTGSRTSSVPDSNRHSSVTESDDVFSHKGSGNIKTPETATSASGFSSFLSSFSFSKGYRKWRFKDFLLFRSASEGRATDRDPLRKYTVLSKTTAYEDVSSSSFRSTENSGSVSKRRGPVSAHELHYTLNRAASEQLKRKTMLPYKQGLLGCLGFNHGVHRISRRFGSLERS